MYGEAQAIGVADGVGGWANVGVDAGIYAKELMRRTRDAIRDSAVTVRDPLDALARAHAETQSQGSATACVLVLNDDVRESCAPLSSILCAGLGLGMWLLRNWYPVHCASPVKRRD